MTCEEFQRVLPELGSGNSLERVAHLRSCSQCAGLLADLNEIARQAKQLRASEEPSTRVWHSIETALRNEGLIGGDAAELVARGAHQLHDEPHVRSCPECAAVLADLDAISQQARLLQGAEEPSPRVWNSLEIALRSEGLIGQPEVERPRPRHAPRWKLVWLAPLAAAAAVVLAAVLFQHGNGSQRSVQPPELASVAPAPLQETTASPEEEQMVKLVADRTPALSAAYAADLKAVNDYIRDAQSSALANPQDEMAHQHLMSAYEQRAMIYEMAMNRALR